jgi:hypothetical protein
MDAPFEFPPMKTLSVKNPWADLIARGIKDVENRTWPTKHRGKILIHASAKPDARHREISLLYTKEQWRSFSDDERFDQMVRQYTASAIIGEVSVVACIKNSQSVWAERDCWHWVLEGAVLYKEPILNVKGKLMLWEFDTAAHGLAL